MAQHYHCGGYEHDQSESRGYEFVRLAYVAYLPSRLERDSTFGVIM